MVIPMKPSIKTVLSAVLLFCLLFTALPAATAAFAASGGAADSDGQHIPDDAYAKDEDENAPPDLSGAQCAMLYNLDSNFLMHDYHGEEKLYPASTVKLMTAVTALDYLSDRLDETVTVPPEVIRETTGVSMELRTGERITVRQLFAGLLIAGANDAAYTLALESCGNVELFVARMNEKAKSFGMTSTVYTNVTGVDNAAAYTTGRDVLALSVKAYGIELIRQLTAEPIFEIAATNEHSARTLHTRNYLLSKKIFPYYYTPEASGMNAGATTKGGNCLVAVETIGNVRYLCVIMNAGERQGDYQGQPVTLTENYLLANELFKWGSKTFEYRTIVSPMYVYGEIEVKLSGGNDYVTAVPTDSVLIFLPKGADTADYARVEATLTVESFTAPVSQGTEVGTVTVYGTDGSVIGQSPLVTKSSINLSQWRFIGAKLFEMAQSRAFAVCISLFFFACLVSVLVTARIRFVRARRIALRTDGEEEDLLPAVPRKPR